jgi:hypothetical protein
MAVFQSSDSVTACRRAAQALKSWSEMSFGTYKPRQFTATTSMLCSTAVGMSFKPGTRSTVRTAGRRTSPDSMKPTISDMSPVIPWVKSPTVCVTASAPPSMPMYLMSVVSEKLASYMTIKTLRWSKPPEDDPAAKATDDRINHIVQSHQRAVSGHNHHARISTNGTDETHLVSGCTAVCHVRNLNRVGDLADI